MRATRPCLPASLAPQVRWAVDLGGDSYDYPLLAYFGRFRFSYHLLSSEGHNVLSFDEDEQHRRGSGAIVAADVAPGARPWATLDVTTAYGGASRVSRSFALDYAPGDAGDAACAPVRVMDAWVHAGAARATWTMHTTAAVAIDAAGPLLTEAPQPGGGAPPALRLVAESPAGGGDVVWAVRTLAVPTPQTTTYGGRPVYVVTATLPAAAGALNISLRPCQAVAGG